MRAEERRFMFYLNKYFYWLLVAVILILMAGFYLFILYPRLTNGDVSHYFNYKDQTDSLDLLKKQKHEVEGVFAEYNKFSQENLKKLEPLLPAEKQVPDLIIQLDGFANQAGLVLSSFDISEKVSKDKKVVATVSQPAVKELAISLNLRGGDYNQVKQFVSLVETNLRLMDITSFGFVPGGQQGFAVNLRTYFYN